MSFIKNILSRPAFVIVIEHGQAKISKGKVTKHFLVDINVLTKQHQILSGKIIGRDSGKGVTLEFTDEFPTAVCDTLSKVYRQY